jgi:hypothetical protein
MTACMAGRSGTPGDGDARVRGQPCLYAAQGVHFEVLQRQAEHSNSPVREIVTGDLVDLNAPGARLGVKSWSHSPRKGVRA